MPHDAHSLPDEPDRTKWEALVEHEQAIAGLSMRFLARVDARLATRGDLLRRWHDIGKYSREFQADLASAGDDEVHGSEISGKVDQSNAGAPLAKHFTATRRSLKRICMTRNLASHC